MSNYKTQCPRCHTIYPMPESKLNDNKARANCGQCRHTFFLNAHLIKDDTTGLIQDGNSKDDLNLPRVPIRPKKRKPIVAKEGMIFDGMQMDNEPTDDISMDGLDEFLHQEIITQPTEASAQAKANYQSDEAWLDELIKDDSNEALRAVPMTSRPQDDLSDLIGADLDSLIPQAPSTPKNPELIRQKINERINHAPTQEQLETGRSWGGQVAWAIGSLALVALLGVQYVFFNGDSIAKTDKAPLVNKLCKDCLTNANISALTASYSLQTGQADFTTDLIGTLANTSATDQLYPNLKITVMGHNGLIGDLALAPKDYLDSPQRLLGASSSGRFMLTLDAPTKEIVSVTIEPFY